MRDLTPINQTPYWVLAFSLAVAGLGLVCIGYTIGLFVPQLIPFCQSYIAAAVAGMSFGYSMSSKAWVLQKIRYSRLPKRRGRVWWTFSCVFSLLGYIIPGMLLARSEAFVGLWWPIYVVSGFLFFSIGYMMHPDALGKYNIGQNQNYVAFPLVIVLLSGVFLPGLYLGGQYAGYFTWTVWLAWLPTLLIGFIIGAIAAKAHEGDQRKKAMKALEKFSSELDEQQICAVLEREFDDIADSYAIQFREEVTPVIVVSKGDDKIEIYHRPNESVEDAIQRAKEQLNAHREG